MKAVLLRGKPPKFEKKSSSGLSAARTLKHETIECGIRELNFSVRFCTSSRDGLRRGRYCYLDGWSAANGEGKGEALPFQNRGFPSSISWSHAAIRP